MKNANWKVYTLWISLAEAAGLLSGLLSRVGMVNFSQTVAQPPLLQMIDQKVNGAGGKSVNLYNTFVSHKDEGLYYRTDHHWTSLGAYKAYSAYMDMLGREYPAQTEFAVESHPGFYGSTYSRSGLWWIPSEPVELWKNDVAFTVENKETEQLHEGLFYEERLAELDKYTVYLDGNHSVVTIRNPQAAGKGHLLVFRDSYANCLGTFLANSYETVTLVDLRYCQDPRNPVSNMALEGQYDQVLICYSLGNFLTDDNFVWLR
jgi:hypothetical protein